MGKPRIKLKNKKTNILSLVKKRPSPQIVEMLDYASIEAKNGDLCAVVVCKVYSDGHYDFVYSGINDPHISKAIASLELAKMDVTLIGLSQDSGSFLAKLVTT